MSPLDAPANNLAVGPSPAPPPGGGVVPSVYSGAFEHYVPMPGFLRIDITISGGDAYLQISESLDRRDWPDPIGHETFLPEGSHSIPLVRWALGWRLRSASSVSGVTITSARTIG